MLCVLSSSHHNLATLIDTVHSVLRLFIYTNFVSKQIKQSFTLLFFTIPIHIRRALDDLTTASHTIFFATFSQQSMLSHNNTLLGALNEFIITTHKMGSARFRDYFFSVIKSTCFVCIVLWLRRYEFTHESWRPKKKTETREVDRLIRRRIGAEFQVRKTDRPRRQTPTKEIDAMFGMNGTENVKCVQTIECFSINWTGFGEWNRVLAFGCFAGCLWDGISTKQHTVFVVGL